MEHSAQWLQEQERLRENRQTPSWLLLQQELAPINSIYQSIYFGWLLHRRGTTPNGFPFSMTQEELEKINFGFGSSVTGGRAATINFYNKLVNYFDNLDINNNPIHMDSFKEWKTWWGNSLDIVIPKSELVDEYNSIYFKGDDNLTIFDKMKLIELRYKIGPYPDTIEHPEFLNIPRTRFIHNFNIESYYERTARLNRASGKYKRTKKHKKYKKHKKKNGKNTHHRSKH
jgi:hypothetical protein